VPHMRVDGSNKNAAMKEAGQQIAGNDDAQRNEKVWQVAEKVRDQIVGGLQVESRKRHEKRDHGN
jgi:hypothetical protein